MKLKAEHFDLLGIISFPFILVYALSALSTGQIPAEWMTQTLIVIGIGGIIIDGTLVYRFFFKRRR